MRDLVPKRLVLPGAVGLFVLLVVGHIYYWYWPRSRAASPEPGSGVAETLRLERFPVALWMPYPHQNLAHLARAAGLERESLEPLARLSGLPAPAIPSFGSLPFPPSSELAIASDEAGQSWLISAQVYPLFAAFARLSGHLADNPWLKGGVIEVEGRRIEVRWQDNRWEVASPGFPERELMADPPPVVPSLAILQLRYGVHPLPAGRFLLRRSGGGWELASEGVDPRAPWAGSEVAKDLARQDAFLFVASGRIEPLGEAAQALVFLSQDAGGALELPRVASIYENGGERWSLPGESILELSGRVPDAEPSSGWQVSAFDSVSLGVGRELAPGLDRLFAPRDEGRLLWGLWLDLDAGLNEVSRIAYMLGQVPIVPRRRLDQWRDIERVLRPMTRRLFRLQAEVTESGAADAARSFRLRLEPDAPPLPGP